MQETLRITDKVWNQIREQFSEEEKAEMNRHIEGESICPRSIIVDLGGLESAELADKLADAVGKAR